MEHSWIRMNIEAILLSPSQNRAPCDQPCPSRDIYGVRAPESFAEAAASLGRGYDSRGKMKWSQQTGTSKTGTRVLRLHLGAAKSLDRRSHRHGSGRGDRPGASSDDLAALLALPNTHARSLDGVLATESASIARGSTRMTNPTCCAGRSQSSSQSYAEKNHISFRTFRKFQPS